jgi:hypothetical protein
MMYIKSEQNHERSTLSTLNTRAKITIQIFFKLGVGNFNEFSETS